MSTFGGKADMMRNMSRCPLMTQSGPGATRSSVTNGTIFDPKCDIVFVPEVVLGVGEAMRRRDFISLLCSATIAWPLRVKAQQSAVPVIGLLHLGTPEANADMLVAFRNGLSDTGYVDTRDVTIEYRWADNDSDRLPELVADLIRRQVSVIAVPGGLQAALAAKAKTTTIPIVFSIGAGWSQASIGRAAMSLASAI
jgi:hypothetical protein